MGYIQTVFPALRSSALLVLEPLTVTVHSRLCDGAFTVSVGELIHWTQPGVTLGGNIHIV